MNRPAERLPPCPHPGNCVCTEDGDAQPLAYGSLSPEAARECLRVILRSRATVCSDRGDRVHATFRVAVFTDDLHVRFDDLTRTIHLRSASRVGRYDFGVNRRRIERLQRLWNAAAG